MVKVKTAKNTGKEWAKKVKEFHVNNENMAIDKA